MEPTQITFAVTLNYSSSKEDLPYIKAWWAKQRVLEAVQESLPKQMELISDTTITTEPIEILERVPSSSYYSPKE